MIENDEQTINNKVISFDDADDHHHDHIMSRSVKQKTECLMPFPERTALTNWYKVDRVSEWRVKFPLSTILSC